MKILENQKDRQVWVKRLLLAVWVVILSCQSMESGVVVERSKEHRPAWISYPEGEGQPTKFQSVLVKIRIPKIVQIDRYLLGFDLESAAILGKALTKHQIDNEKINPRIYREMLNANIEFFRNNINIRDMYYEKINSLENDANRQYDSNYDLSVLLAVRSGAYRSHLLSLVNIIERTPNRNLLSNLKAEMRDLVGH